MATFRFKLKQPLPLKRRALHAGDPGVYQGEILAVTASGHTGFGELVYSRKLAKEMATLDLKSRLEGASIPELLNRPVFHEEIPVAWMYPSLTPSPSPPYGEGSNTLKFKVGSKWALEAEQLIELRHQLGPEIGIRLDANQGLSLEDAIQFGKRVASIKLAYFEEPLKNPLDIPKFTAATGIPVALDESLSQNMGIPEGVTTLALKPFMMPDMKTIFGWIDRANQEGLDLSICSCFESSLGLSWLVMLAGMASPKLLPAGLSTYSWFAENFFEPQFTVSAALGLIQGFSNKAPQLPRFLPCIASELVFQ